MSRPKRTSPAMADPRSWSLLHPLSDAQRNRKEVGEPLTRSVSTDAPGSVRPSRKSGVVTSTLAPGVIQVEGELLSVESGFSGTMTAPAERKAVVHGEELRGVRQRSATTDRLGECQRPGSAATRSARSLIAPYVKRRPKKLTHGRSGLRAAVSSRRR